MTVRRTRKATSYKFISNVHLTCVDEVLIAMSREFMVPLQDGSVGMRYPLCEDMSLCSYLSNSSFCIQLSSDLALEHHILLCVELDVTFFMSVLEPLFAAVCPQANLKKEEGR